MSLCLFVCLLYIFSIAAALLRKVLSFLSKKKCTFNYVFVYHGSLVYSFLYFILFFFFMQAIVGLNYSDSLSCVLLKKFRCACLYFWLQALVIAQPLLYRNAGLCPCGLFAAERVAEPRAVSSASCRSSWTWPGSSCFCTKKNRLQLSRESLKVEVAHNPELFFQWIE